MSITNSVVFTPPQPAQRIIDAFPADWITRTHSDTAPERLWITLSITRKPWGLVQLLEPHDSPSHLRIHPLLVSYRNTDDRNQVYAILKRAFAIRWLGEDGEELTIDQTP